MEKLLDAGAGYNYALVRRWTKKFDVFALERVFVPVNIGNTHWCLAVVHVQRRRVQYYDSMGGGGRVYLDALQRWLGDEWRQKKGDAAPAAPPDFGAWPKVPTTRDTPRQENGSDCGVFACACADYLAEDLDLDFAQRDIGRVRYRIGDAILKGKLDPAL